MENFDFGLCLYSDDEDYSFRCRLVIIEKEVIDIYRDDYHPATIIIRQEFITRVKGTVDEEGYQMVWIQDKKGIYDILLKLVPYFTESQRKNFDQVAHYFRGEKIRKNFERRTPTHQIGEGH